VAELTPDVIEVLKSKHPDGPEDPFGDTLGPSQGHSPTADDIKTALASFKVCTSPGISGWTVPSSATPSSPLASSTSSPPSPPPSARTPPPARPCSARQAHTSLQVR